MRRLTQKVIYIKKKKKKILKSSLPSGRVWSEQHILRISSSHFLWFLISYMKMSWHHVTARWPSAELLMSAMMELLWATDKQTADPGAAPRSGTGMDASPVTALDFHTPAAGVISRVLWTRQGEIISSEIPLWGRRALRTLAVQRRASYGLNVSPDI